MTEAILHEQICSYIKLQYPDVIFTSEAAGYFATIGQAAKRKRTRSRRGLPDLIILEPRKGYHGLMIEIKGEGKSPYKKNGQLRNDPHVQEQAKVLEELNQKGYMAVFCTGWDEAIAVIGTYME